MSKRKGSEVEWAVSESLPGCRRCTHEGKTEIGSKTTLITRDQAPGLMREFGVGGDADNLGVEGLEFGECFVECVDFSRANNYMRVGH